MKWDYNNDIPASMRATRNLHKPEHHMLFHLDAIESIVNSRWSRVESGEWRVESQGRRDEWRALLDKLRVSELMDYWLSDKYHDVAAEELKKVDWSRLPKKANAQYEKPVWMLKTRRRFMQIGSYCKQKLIRLRYK